MPIFPEPPTPAEREHGLSASRRRELEQMAAELTSYKAKGRHVVAVEKMAAKAVDRSVAYYRRRFNELAIAAKWEYRTPQDFLRGKPTQRGGYRGERAESSVPLDVSVALGGRVLPETKEAVTRARELLQERAPGSGSFDRFLAAAAQHILAGHVFLTVDSEEDKA